MKRDSEKAEAETIVAKWTTSFGTPEQHFGTIEFDDGLVLSFPFLKSENEVPFGTSVLWGVTDGLRQCTVLAQPFGPHGTTSTPTERIHSTRGLVNHLLIGRRYIREPAGKFVSEISFTPVPNRDLHVLELYEWFQPNKDVAEVKLAPSSDTRLNGFASSFLAFFMPDRPPLFETNIETMGATVKAWIGGKTGLTGDGESRSHIGFGIRFNEPQTVDAATDEALRLCTFLSFTAHQYIYPDSFYVMAAGEEDLYELRLGSRFVGQSPLEHSSVRHTLVLADQDPDRFCHALRRWYATNDTDLRSRFLYRYSLRRPETISAERFVQIFQALEGLVDFSTYQFLTAAELKTAETALREALPTSPQLEPLIQKLRSTNTASPKTVLKRELPKILAAAGIAARFDMDAFVERIYERRNKASHGGSHLDDEAPQAVMTDTALVTVICLIIECGKLGLDPRDGLSKFKGAHLHLDLPLRSAG
jgi:hypothetical protein